VEVQSSKLSESVRNRMGGGDWPTSLRKPSKSVVALILSTTGALG